MNKERPTRRIIPSASDLDAIRTKKYHVQATYLSSRKECGAVKSWILLSASLTLFVLCARPVHAQGRETATVETAMEVLQDITAIPDKGLPAAVLRGSEAVVIIPDLIKLGFLVG